MFKSCRGGGVASFQTHQRRLKRNAINLLPPRLRLWIKITNGVESRWTKFHFEDRSVDSVTRKHSKERDRNKEREEGTSYFPQLIVRLTLLRGFDRSMTRKRFFQLGDRRQYDVSPLCGAQYAYCPSDVRASDSRNVNPRQWAASGDIGSNRSAGKIKRLL